MEVRRGTGRGERGWDKAEESSKDGTEEEEEEEEEEDEDEDEDEDEAGTNSVRRSEPLLPERATA